jgi:hypothetical protein
MDYFNSLNVKSQHKAKMIELNFELKIKVN